MELPKKDEERSALYKRMAVVTHSVIFLYSAAFWIQTGVMPFLSKNLGADPVIFGYLETVFAVAMLVGGPLFGRFGDLYGARAALVVAFVSSFLTYAILAVASSISMLFLSRVMAFMMHAMHGSQMVMTDVSGVSQRADALGKLGVSYGIGMVVGPTLGGLVSSYTSTQYAAAVAAALCLVAIAIVMVFVPRTTKDPKKVRQTKKEDSGGVLNMEAILSLLKIPTVLFIVVLKTVVGIPAGIFHAMFAMVNMERFELTPETNGRLLSYVGILTLVMQGFGVGFFSKRFSDVLLLKASIVIMTVSYLLLSFANSLVLLCAVMVPMVMSGALLNTITSSAITKSVPESATGTSLGLSMATHSIIRAVSPTVGGYMYSLVGYASFGLLGFLFNGGLAVYLTFLEGGQVSKALA